MEDIQKNLTFIKELENFLDLTYVSETPVEGRVCFAESEGLRPEFKSIFTTQNLNDYLFALKNFEDRFEADLLEKNAEGFRFPKSAEVFWKMVDEGNKFRDKK